MGTQVDASTLDPEPAIVTTEDDPVEATVGVVLDPKRITKDAYMKLITESNKVTIFRLRIHLVRILVIQYDFR